MTRGSEEKDVAARGESSAQLGEQRATAPESVPSAHTPGPWWIAPKHEGETYIVGGDYLGSGSVVCQIRTYTVGEHAESEANARLIAAAPDLYEALAQFMEKWPAAEKAINDAIVIQHIHGGTYAGLNLTGELLAMSAALAKAGRHA